MFLSVDNYRADCGELLPSAVSLMSKINGVEKYESGEFKAEGYKEWKLVLYPNRNKSKSEEENICLYLAMTYIRSLPLGWEVYVVFLLVLLVQNKGKNLIVQGCYFHNLVTSQYCFVKHVRLICYSVSCLAQMPWEREDGLTN